MSCSVDVCAGGQASIIRCPSSLERTERSCIACIYPQQVRFPRAWDVDFLPGAFSAVLEALTIARQIMRVFDCGRAPCKDDGRNQPNRHDAHKPHFARCSCVWSVTYDKHNPQLPCQDDVEVRFKAAGSFLASRNSAASLPHAALVWRSI